MKRRMYGWIGCLLMLTAVSCDYAPEQQTPELKKPVYRDFENDLQAANLFGKVKSVKEQKKSFLDSTTSEQAYVVDDYDQEGHLLKRTYTGSDGKPLNMLENGYENGKLMQSKTTVFNDDSTQVTTYNNVLNASDKVVQTEVDTEYMPKRLFLMEYDENGNTRKKMEIYEGDTIVSDYINSYDNAKRVVKVTEIKNRRDTINLYNFKYDENGNLIESASNMDFLQTRREFVFNNDILTEIKHYIVSQDDKEVMDQVAKYDSLYNMVHKVNYVEGTPTVEYKNEYEFDSEGNWIRKKTYIKGKNVGKETFVPMEELTREIVYYN